MHSEKLYDDTILPRQINTAHNPTSTDVHENGRDVRYHGWKLSIPILSALSEIVLK
jgi:hypothetical protein